MRQLVAAATVLATILGATATRVVADPPLPDSQVASRSHGAGDSEPSKLPRVIRYGIFERTFRWPHGSENPWEDVKLSARFRSPSGILVRVDGFHYGGERWKLRFSPSEVGHWSFIATLRGGGRTERSTGAFRVVSGARPGFVRENPDNPFRWVFDDGSPYYPIGIGDCILDVDGSGTPLDNWGLDGDVRGPGDPEYGWVVNMDTYLDAYEGAGVNLFRWSVDNCSFPLDQRIGPEGNEYLVREGRWGDSLVRSLRGHGFRVFMTIFGFDPPFPDAGPGSPQMAAVERYVRYVVARYGAFVDFWELMNEALVEEPWYEEIAGYLRRVDPYDHPISTSWERPELSAIEINSPHWYQLESEFDSDVETWVKMEDWKAFGKPVIVGEQGNSVRNWDDRSALRMRLRAWTAFFAEGVLIFWNTSAFKDYETPIAANIYLGPEERAFIEVLQRFTSGFDPSASTATIHVSDPLRVRAYGLEGVSGYAGYMHAFTDHADPTMGIEVTIDLPVAGLAQWIDPSSGLILASQHVDQGIQTLSVPAFVTDVALKVTSPQYLGPGVSR